MENQVSNNEIIANLCNPDAKISINNEEFRLLSSVDFSVHKSAIDKILELCTKDKSGSDTTFMRLMVDAGGCSGMQYHLILDDWKSSDMDLIVVDANSKVVFVTDNYSLEYIKGGSIKYMDAQILEDGTLGSGDFKIDNPNATGCCDCGNSFACGM